MRAARLTAFGGPDAIEVVEVPDPTPAPHEVVVRVERCGVNRADVNFSHGEYGAVSYSDLHKKAAGFGAVKEQPFPRALGIEPAGTVVAVGGAVDPSLVGTRVVVIPRFGCGTCAVCRRDADHLCLQLRTLGTSTPDRGGLDELLCVPERNVVPLPDSVTMDQAAGIAADLAPAWWIVHDLAGMRAGMTVAVKGASGSVGLSVLDFAALAGARTVAQTRSADKVDTLRDAGADAVIVADPGDAAAAMRDATGGGADIVVEPFGGDSWSDSLRAVANGGAIAVVGTFVQSQTMTDLSLIFHHAVRVVGAAHSPRATVHQMVHLVASGQLAPRHGVTVPLDRVQDAFTLQRESAVVGKIVVDLT